MYFYFPDIPGLTTKTVTGWIINGIIFDLLRTLKICATDESTLLVVANTKELLAARAAGLRRLKFLERDFTLGFFDAEEAAARAYDSKAKELFGEFSQLNFP